MANAVTEQTFETEVLASEQPVLVDFWAEWCGPCHAVAPVLDQIAAERSELKVVKLNIDEQPAVAQRYGVMSIPTLILFKDGEPVAAAVGAMPKSMLEERLGLAEPAAERQEAEADKGEDERPGLDGAARVAVVAGQRRDQEEDGRRQHRGHVPG